ncbi:MAG: ANTAR domain-containing protein, partial [Firmicutes bacterium]|nr:ANTAR domain-containing protein [Bacillota bacterium]
KVIEKAKGLLMDNFGISESEAFRRIQKMSMDKRLPMREIADAIILSHGITGRLKK